MIEYENTDLFFFIHDGFYVGLCVFKLSESDRTAIVWVILSFNWEWMWQWWATNFPCCHNPGAVDPLVSDCKPQSRFWEFSLPHASFDETQHLSHESKFFFFYLKDKELRKSQPAFIIWTLVSPLRQEHSWLHAYWNHRGFIFIYKNTFLMNRLCEQIYWK